VARGLRGRRRRHDAGLQHGGERVTGGGCGDRDGGARTGTQPGCRCAAPASAPAPAPVSCTYLDLGGNTKPCDPRWPSRTPPTDGATQDQVDGWNAMCQTMLCIATRCPDARVFIPFYVAYNFCPAPEPSAAPAAATTMTMTMTTSSTTPP
jgi:hypothetical protein